jgi:hypothetical protein
MLQNRSHVLLLACVAFFVILAVAGFGWWDWASQYAVGWFAAALACWKAAELP